MSTEQHEEITTAQNTYPSADLAYPIAIASYDMALRRFDAMDAKINTLTAFAVTVSLAIPVIANAKNLSFQSVWFAIAAAAFITGIGLATFARVTGELFLLDPMVLHQSYLDAEPAQFKIDMIFYAGKHCDTNCRLINRNGRIAAITATLFAVEAVAVAAWVVSARPL